MTDLPLRRSRHAAARPDTPAPTTTTSTLRPPPTPASARAGPGRLSAAAPAAADATSVRLLIPRDSLVSVLSPAARLSSMRTPSLVLPRRPRRLGDVYCSDP